MWSKVQLSLIRHRQVIPIVAIASVLLLRPALAMADSCSGTFSIGDFFFGCTNDDGTQSPNTLIGLITQIINLILAFIGVKPTNNG